MLVHYDPHLETGISCDVSNIGIDTVLFHHYSNRSKHPITNAYDCSVEYRSTKKDGNVDDLNCLPVSGDYNFHLEEEWADVNIVCKVTHQLNPVKPKANYTRYSKGRSPLQSATLYQRKVAKQEEVKQFKNLEDSPTTDRWMSLVSSLPYHLAKLHAEVLELRRLA